MPDSTCPGSHADQNAGSTPTIWWYQTYAPAQTRAPGTTTGGTRPLGQRPEPGGDHRRHHGARHQREAGAQHVVPPDVLQPQDVRQQVGVEAQPRPAPWPGSRPRTTRSAAARGRRPAPGVARARTKARRSRTAASERAQHPRAPPAPVVPLITPRFSSARATASSSGAGDVRERRVGRAPRLSTSVRGVATTASTPNGRLTRNAHRQPPSSTSAPPIGGPGRRPRRRSLPTARSRARGGRGERLDHERQRGRDEHRRAERLAARGRRRAARATAPAHRADARVKSAMPPRTPASADQVGQPAAHDEERGEHDVVGVEHPRQRADRARPGTTPDGGNATLTIVASRKARKAPKQATRRTRVGAARPVRARSPTPQSPRLTPLATLSEGERAAQGRRSSPPPMTGHPFRTRTFRNMRHAVFVDETRRPPGP